MATLVLCDVNSFFFLFLLFKGAAPFKLGIFVVEPLWALFMQPIPNASSSTHPPVTLVPASVRTRGRAEAAAELYEHDPPAFIHVCVRVFI